MLALPAPQNARRGKTRAELRAQVNRIGSKIARRALKRALARKGFAASANKIAPTGTAPYSQTLKPLMRRERRPRFVRMIAYDFETTRIRPGTPQPLYLTAYGDGFQISERIARGDRAFPQLLELLRNNFLTAEFNRTRFVGWNANNFDVYFISIALLHSEDFILRPYLTRSKNLRGLRVISKTILNERGKPCEWEFLDGWSMVYGSTPVKLAAFVEKFAPDFPKLEGPDFDNEEFNPDNPKHVAYAERDSEGLFHAMQKAQEIVKETFGFGLQPTAGNLGIKIFQANIPGNVQCWSPAFQVVEIVREYVMRGGFCFCVRRYQGPIWKYDINQAYPAAMRDALLPSGRCIHTRGGMNPYAQTAICKIRATKRGNKVPFYYRDAEGVGCFGLDEIGETWITTIELKQLQVENWSVKILESYFWDESFRMKSYVDKMEALRATDPKGARGTMVKNIGNASYGKTCEFLEGIELQLACAKPEGTITTASGKIKDAWHEYPTDNPELSHVWYKFGDPKFKDYHQPQIAAFITAHVRMQVRRAALTNPDAWLYADTDSCAFSEPVDLPIDSAKYGYWKIEAEGKLYRILNKKVYCEIAEGDKGERKAKGLNVKRLTDEDFARWFDGEPPVQTQTQRQNYIKVMSGFDMYISHTRTGEAKPEKRLAA